MRALAWLPVSLLFVLACSEEPDKPDAVPPLPPGDDDDDEDDGRFEPVAVGFVFDGVILSDGTITGYTLPDGTEAPPTVILRLASEKYFTTGDDTQVCQAWGEWAPELREEPLPTANGMPVWNSYEAPLELQYHNCVNLTEDWGEDGIRVAEVFHGMRLGLAFGPMTDYLRDAWNEANLEKYGDSMMAQYVAINDPEGNFVGEDWTTSILWQYDALTGELVADDEGVLQPISVKGLPPGAAVPEGYIRSWAYWYQDFPLMDFDKLKDMPDE